MVSTIFSIEMVAVVSNKYRFLQISLSPFTCVSVLNYGRDRKSLGWTERAKHLCVCVSEFVYVCEFVCVCVCVCDSEFYFKCTCVGIIKHKKNISCFLMTMYMKME